MADRPSVAIVGNAPSEGDQSRAVDTCDVVVRLNKAPGFGGPDGSRVDQLVLINCGGQMAEWLATGTILSLPVFQAAATVVLPIHPGKVRLIEPPLSPAELRDADAQDFSPAATALFEAEGKRVVAWPAEVFADAMASLGVVPLGRGDRAPSTGYLAAHWWLRPGTHVVHAFGFGFDGWRGHDFAAERRWFADHAAAGRLVLHPLPSLAGTA